MHILYIISNTLSVHIFDNPALQRTLNAFTKDSLYPSIKKIKDQTYMPHGSRHFCLFCSLNLNVPEQSLAHSRCSISIC